LEQIGSLLPRAIKSQMLRRKAPVAHVLATLWPHVVGRLIAQHSRPETFSEGILRVAASSAAWTAQLGEMRAFVVGKANEVLGSAVVRKVVVRHQKDWDVGKTGADGTRSAIPDLASADLERARAILWPQGKAKLDPAVAEAVERSFVKYFSRRARNCA
jgi:hypothetical protein